jgi:hypothetical protein
MSSPYQQQVTPQMQEMHAPNQQSQVYHSTPDYQLAPPSQQGGYQQPMMFDPNMQGHPLPPGQIPVGYYQQQPELLTVPSDAVLLCQHCMQSVKPEFTTISKFSILD